MLTAQKRYVVCKEIIQEENKQVKQYLDKMETILPRCPPESQLQEVIDESNRISATILARYGVEYKEEVESLRRKEGSSYVLMVESFVQLYRESPVDEELGEGADRFHPLAKKYLQWERLFGSVAQSVQKINADILAERDKRIADLEMKIKSTRNMLELNKLHEKCEGLRAIKMPIGLLNFYRRQELINMIEEIRMKRMKLEKGTMLTEEEEEEMETLYKDGMELKEDIEMSLRKMDSQLKNIFTNFN